MMRDKIVVLATNNTSHMVVFWRIGVRVAARPVSDNAKVERYRTLSGDNFTIRRQFNHGCEIVKFEKPLTSKIKSESPSVVEDYVELVKKTNLMCSVFREIVNDHIQELESLSED